MPWEDLVPHILWSEATVDTCPPWFDEDRRWAEDMPRDDRVLDQILRENYNTWLAVQKEVMRSREENVFQVSSGTLRMIGVRNAEI